MKKITVLLMFFCMTGVSLFADNSNNFTWKQGVASTTYGIILLPLRIDSGNSEQEVMLPGLDIRLFNGKNVAKRGGFYTGVETGALMFFISPDQLESMDGVQLSSDLFVASVFVLAKYGYRIDIGIKLFGISLGWEMGIGARIASGFFELYGDDGTDSSSLEAGYEASYMSMMLDTAVEGAVRLGPNFRFVAKLGGMLTPPLISSSDSSASTPLNSFSFESEPYMITARAGFIMSY